MADSPFPQGNNIAVVTSWDQGTATDKILHRKLEEFGYKGTFFVSPNLIGTPGYLDVADVQAMIKDGHEIGSQGLGNRLGTLSPEEALQQMKESKAKLEAMFDVPVRGFAYPDGLEPGQNWLAEAAKEAGYFYARTTQIKHPQTVETFTSENSFQIPVSAYGHEDFFSIQTKWMDVEDTERKIFHLMGQTGPLGEDPEDWLDLDCIIGFLGGISRIWYCTAGELAAHLQTAR
jgi:peptidoglycan/xylan/chitin deacetylase (PgdA/CDA1 family)